MAIKVIFKRRMIFCNYRQNRQTVILLNKYDEVQDEFENYICFRLALPDFAGLRWIITK